jgi:hypothetical protein
MDVVLAFLVLIVSLAGALSILVPWLGHRARGPTADHSRQRLRKRGLRPAEIVKADGGFIPMPEDLRTHEEMVAWMARELPQRIAKAWMAK